MGNDNVVLFNGKAPTGGGGGTPEETQLAECPVQAIGYNGDIFYYVTADGVFKQLSAQKHTYNSIYSLFAGHSSWLLEKFGKLRNPDDFDHTKTLRYLMDEAVKVGVVDLENTLRGVGVWRSRRNGLVVHTGDRIEVDGEWGPAGQKVENKLYMKLPAIDRPASHEATGKQVSLIFRFIRDSWNWSDRDIQARLLLGWIGCGVLAGAMPWRPHLWVTAEQGAGKSKLDVLVQALLGSGSDKVSDPTGAAVRAILGVSARGMLCDEVEPGDNKRAETLIELMRMASTDSQGSVARGTADGGVQRWPIRACFLCSSILVPFFRPQDYGRITILEMKPLPPKSSLEIRDFEASFREICTEGGMVRRRVIRGFSRYEANFDTYAAVMAAEGKTLRARDQIATLLAMADAMLQDDPITEKEAADILGTVDVGELTGGDEIGDSIECLQHLLSTKMILRFKEGSQDYTIGDLIAECPQNAKNFKHRELRKIGIAIVEENGVELLAISNTHGQLQRIFKETRHRGGGHARVLKRLPYAQELGKRTISFGGYKSAATWLLLSDLPIDRNMQAEEAEPAGDVST